VEKYSFVELRGFSLPEKNTKSAIMALFLQIDGLSVTWEKQYFYFFLDVKIGTLKKGLLKIKNKLVF
jgi:hypothetical protein